VPPIQSNHVAGPVISASCPPVAWARNIRGMLKLLAATGVALVLTSMAVVHTSSPNGGQPTGGAAAEEAVRAAELARFKAQTTGDLTALDALLGDDLVYTHSNALVDSKASYVESMRSGALKYQTIEPREMKVRVYGTTAVITAAARITAISRGQPVDNQLRYTDVWVLRDGRWQMVGWQSTRLP
jgi:ketosteroid isomerase-like protein